MFSRPCGTKFLNPEFSHTLFRPLYALPFAYAENGPFPAVYSTVHFVRLFPQRVGPSQEFARKGCLV
jgi:hypothetical protein